ncbi:hypothetical protein KCP70_00925 [Salmonella enterica subsp. enterica]|nr:hypothetical protein KCP70_00925 [Salmonella enterica subsp. enterica]
MFWKSRRWWGNRRFRVIPRAGRVCSRLLICRRSRPESTKHFVFVLDNHHAFARATNAG